MKLCVLMLMSLCSHLSCGKHEVYCLAPDDFQGTGKRYREGEVLGDMMCVAANTWYLDTDVVNQKVK